AWAWRDSCQVGADVGRRLEDGGLLRVVQYVDGVPVGARVVAAERSHPQNVAGRVIRLDKYLYAHTRVPACHRPAPSMRSAFSLTCAWTTATGRPAGSAPHGQPRRLTMRTKSSC